MKQHRYIVTAFISLCLCARGEEVAVESHGLRVRVDGVSMAASADVKAIIEEQAALTEDSTVTPPLADDLAFFLRLRYRELGYREAVVTWKVVDNTGLLHVNEGERYNVGVISYKGNTSQKETDLNAYLLRPTHEKLGHASVIVPFVEADLKAGADLVQRYFQAQGFLNAAVEPPLFSPHSNSHTVDVLVKVKEGQRSIFGTVQATGELNGQEREVAKLFKDLTGQPFNEVTIETARKKIVGIYEQLGYYTVTVKSETDVTRHADGSVPVLYRISTGPLFRITDVAIASSFSTGAQRIIRSNLKRAIDRTYSPSELEFMTRASLDTGVFSRLDVKPRTNGDGTLALDISGEEAKRTTLSASLGFETFQGAIISAEARQVNFRDTGDTVRVKAEYTTHGLNAGIKWLDPAIFETPFSLDAELAAQSLNVFDYQRHTVMLRTGLKRRWNKHIVTNLFGDVSTNKVSSDKLTPDELGPADYQLGTIGAALVLDFRDNPLLPTRGWMSGLTITSASGTTSYLRGDLEFAYYRPFTKKFRAAIRGKSSMIQSSGGVEELPIDLRVYNGGATSVRSFAEREMGPHSRSGDTPLGGRMSQTGSLEFSYEVVPSLELALFGDAGNLSDTVRNPFSQPSGLRYAIGLGLRYKLPIGPLRIDYGFNPDRQRGEPMGALHIAFGFAF